MAAIQFPPTPKPDADTVDRFETIRKVLAGPAAPGATPYDLSRLTTLSFSDLMAKAVSDYPDMAPEGLGDMLEDDQARKGDADVSSAR